MSFDKWVFSIMMASIFLLFFVGKKRKKLRRILVTIFIITFVIPLLPKAIFGRWDAVKFLKGKKITKIVLQPSLPDWDVNLTDTFVTISDTNEIKNILDQLRHSQVYFPNHPLQIWETNMIFITNGNDSFSLHIEKTENNGTLINADKSELRNDELDEYLEKITRFVKPVKAKGYN